MKIVTQIVFWLAVLFVLIALIIRLVGIAGWPPGLRISPFNYLIFGHLLFVASLAWHFIYGRKE